MDAKQQTNRFQNSQASKETGWEPQLQERAMRFGFQNGVPAHKLNAFQQAVYTTFSSIPMDNEEEREIHIYKAAISNMPLFSGNEEEGGELFHFSEDKDTHFAVLGLVEPLRHALTLHFLQGKDLKEISFITGRPEQQVEETLREGVDQLQGALEETDTSATEKRLEFAAKSYKRIEFSLAEKAEPETELEPAAEAVAITAPVSKRSKILLATAGLFLAGLIGASFVIDNGQPDLPLTAAEAESDEQITLEMLDGWKKQYNEIRASSPKRLGIDQRTYDELEYVKQTDQQMERLFSNQNAEKMKNEQKKMQRQVDELMLQIETPKEMVSLFDDAFLTSAETQNFIVNYALKTKEMMRLSEEVLLANKEELADVEVNGELSAEKLLAGRSDFSQELQNMLDSLDERGLTIIKQPLKERFITRRDTEALYASRLFSTDYEAMEYTGLLMNEPYFDAEGLLQPVDQMPSVLTSIERPLLEFADSSPLYEDFALIFQQAFFLTLKGAEEQSVFDEQGVVKEEYQFAWKQLAQQSGNPLLYLMMPIVEEMEASGWRSSASYDALGYDGILAALEMEKAGKLAAKLPNGNVTVEQQIIQLDQHDTASTEKLYKSFSAEHDLELLVDVPPLDVMLLFQYANSLGDADTMWHLMAGTSKPDLEEYKKVWRKQTDFNEYIKWIEVMEDQIMRIGPRLHLYLSVAPVDEADYPPYMPSLVMEGNSTWLVQYHLSEKYRLAQEESGYQSTVNALYNKTKESLDAIELDNASPGEIAGLLLKAYEENDAEVLALLFEEPESLDKAHLITQLSGRNVPKLTDAQNLAFYSDSIYYGNGSDDIERGSFEFAGPNDGTDMNMGQLTMVKTPSGWRFGDLNMY